MEIEIPNINMEHYETLEIVLQYMLLIPCVILVFVLLCLFKYVYRSCNTKKKIESNELVYIKMPDGPIATKSKSLV
jgi:heme/copper-type cytochrome/quinol oxidase subunit 2